MANSSYFPRQDVREIDKNPAWYKEHGLYFEQVYMNLRNNNDKMNLEYNSYNGKTEANSIKHLVSTYGKANRSKYISYRLSKTKLDGIVGEFLKMPLNNTIKTINSDAVTNKMRRFDFLNGAMHVKKALEKVKTYGVDVMQGVEIPDKDDPTAFSKMKFKDKNETIMQILLTSISKEIRLKSKLSNNLQDTTLTARCYGRIVVNELTGDMDYVPIDPRDRICIEYDRDPFLEQSPMMGSVQRMPVHKILTTFKLTKEERDKLDDIRKNPNNYLGSEYRNRYSYQAGEFCADVMHVEWLGVRPKYSKTTPTTERQRFVDESSTERVSDISANEYEENQAKYDKLQAKGKLKITTEWEEDMYELVQIGHDIIPEYHQRRKPFINRDEDTGKILNFSYFGMVFNKVDGDTVSLKDVCDNYDTIFDTIMYQILREANKAKGKLIVYDRAGLPKKTTVKNVLYNALNDSFIDYDSSAAGNMSGKDLSINQIFKEIDLGMSDSFSSLVALKNDIRNELDLITGINDARQGNAPASSTVTNNMQNLESSRTITEPLFYYFTKFSEKVMHGLVETGKLVWGIYQPNKARMILGDEKYGFMKATSSIAFQSYNVSLVNPRWEQAIMDRMRQMAEFSLNAKELRPIDVLDLEMKETLTEKREMLRKAWEEIDSSRRAQAQENNKVNSEQALASQQAQKELMEADREDRQLHDLQKIETKAQADIMVDAAKGESKMTIDQNKFDNESGNNEQ